MFSRLLSKIGRALAKFLSQERDNYVPLARPDHIDAVRKILQPGDVLLVEGRSRFSIGIKYLTQSTWSHSAIYVGNCGGPVDDPNCLVEADVIKGVVVLPLSKYSEHNVRICRAIGLDPGDAQAVIDHVKARIGHQYDLKNVIDLARWLFPTPPIPRRFRRSLMSMGSGDPTRAICSTLIAQAYQSVRYPILPLVEKRQLQSPSGIERTLQVLRIRHHSLFAPRDFDLSPYFSIVKPTLERGFDPAKLVWAEDDPVQITQHNREQDVR
ncbi:MAG: YiiX/YebB-like N1pC/P60 family cysteine hydrolase [Burkholderiaceae bacterium]